MLQAYLYIRVSTEEQANEGFSIDNQKRACQEYAQSRGYRINKVFQEDGKSARTTDRPALQGMLKAIDKEPIDAVVIYKIDRFARNVGDFDRLYREFKSKGIKLLSVTEGDLSEGTSLVPNIFASVAQWESEVNSQRTRDALMQKFREGWQPTPPPIGYRSIGGDRERKTCEPDPHVGPIIRELFELYATGNYSILEIQDWLVARNVVSKGGKGVGHSTICNILNNSFYYGLIRWHGQSKMGNHEPIISEQLFKTCQYVLAKHRDFLTRRRRHNFLLRGFLYCAGCGQRYTAEWHVNEVKFRKRGGKIGYYHCQKMDRNGCNAPYAEVDDMEKQVEKLFADIAFSPDFIHAVRNSVKRKLDKSRKEVDGRCRGILNMKSAEERKRNMLEDRLIEGVISNEVFSRKHDEIQTKIDAYEEELKKVEGTLKMDVNLINETIEITTDVYKMYEKATYMLKRHMLRFFFSKILVKNRVVERVEYTPYFQALIDAKKVILSSVVLPGEDSNL